MPGRGGEKVRDLGARVVQLPVVEMRKAQAAAVVPVQEGDVAARRGAPAARGGFVAVVPGDRQEMCRRMYAYTGTVRVAV